MKQIGVLRKQDNFVGVLRKQVGGMEPELIQTGGGTPQIQFRTSFPRGTRDKKMPLRADPKRGITSREFEPMMASQLAAQQAKEKLQNIRSKRVPLTEQSAIDPVQFSQAQAAQRMEQMDAPLYESAIEAAEPQTYEEKYGLEAAKRAPAAQQEAAYGRGGVGGVTGRGVGTALAGAYGGLQALLALNRASASGQDFASGLGGAALQGLSSYQTTAPTAQDIGGEVGSRVAVRGGQMMDDRAKERAQRDAVNQAYRNTAKRMAAQTAEPTVAVQRTPRPQLTPQQRSYAQQIARVRADAKRERLEQDRAAQQRARGNVPVLGPTAPPPAAPASPSPSPMTMDNSSQSQVEDWYDKQEEEQKKAAEKEKERVENRHEDAESELDKLTRLAGG